MEKKRTKPPQTLYTTWDDIGSRNGEDMDKISIRMTISEDQELFGKFSDVKTRLGFKTNTAVVTYLINDAYENCEQKEPNPQ